MFKEKAAGFDQALIYKETARALGELIPTLKNPDTREELERLARLYKRLARSREKGPQGSPPSKH